jgi:uncharacterized membrane protein
MNKNIFLMFCFEFLFLTNLALAQNLTNQTTSIPEEGINLPLIGKITLVGGVVGVVLLVLGYIIGSAIKSGIKYAFVFLLFIVVLYVLGFLTKEIIIRIGESIGVLKSFYSGFQTNFGMGSGALNFQILMFVVGLMIGLLKG